VSLRRRFWVLTGLRWLSTGFIIPVVALLPLQRGLTIAEYGAAAAVQGFVVLVLELPTGGLADALGRKPVFLASAVFALASYVTFALAQVPLAFALAAGLAGVFRALDSGPLNAWYVDAVTTATPPEERPLEIARGLSGASTVLGGSIAGGAVAAGGLIAWAPFGRDDSLVVPYVVAVALAVLQIVTTVLIMSEDRSHRVAGVWRSARATPAAVGAGVKLLRRSRVLRALVAVELFWGFGMITFESLMPIRLSELIADRDLAASVMGPVTAGGWGAAAIGAAVIPLLLRRWSLTAISVTFRLVQGTTVIAMGLAWGPIGLVAGYLATYAVHIAAGVAYETLLHAEVDNDHRATVLSMASMAMQPAGSLGLIVLGAIATGASTGVAMIVGGVVLALAAPLFLVRPREAALSSVRT
jgi:MFS family permease